MPVAYVNIHLNQGWVQERDFLFNFVREEMQGQPKVCLALASVHKNNNMYTKLTIFRKRTKTDFKSSHCVLICVHLHKDTTAKIKEALTPNLEAHQFLFSLV